MKREAIKALKAAALSAAFTALLAHAGTSATVQAQTLGPNNLTSNEPSTLVPSGMECSIPGSVGCIPGQPSTVWILSVKPNLSSTVAIKYQIEYLDVAGKQQSIAGVFLVAEAIGINGYHSTWITLPAGSQTTSYAIYELGISTSAVTRMERPR